MFSLTVVSVTKHLFARRCVLPDSFKDLGHSWAGSMALGFKPAEHHGEEDMTNLCTS